MNISRYSKGQIVKINSIYPPGHVRTPYFVRGHQGAIDHFWGTYPNPEELAYGRRQSSECPLYRVVFSQSSLWPNYQGSKTDKLYVDIYEHWLEPVK